MNYDPINNFFSALGSALGEAAKTLCDLFLDYFMLLIAVGCWIRFLSQLFVRGNFSLLLLIWALLTTFAAFAMGQVHLPPIFS